MYEEIELLSVGGVWRSERTTTENVVVDGIVCSRAATGRLATMDAGGAFAWEYLAGTDLKSALDYPNGARTEYTYEYAPFGAVRAQSGSRATPRRVASAVSSSAAPGTRGVTCWARSSRRVKKRKGPVG